MIKITINTENDAFVPEPWPEVKRILQSIEANKMEDLDRKKLYDYNGNPVGLIQIKGNIEKKYTARGVVYGDLWDGTSGGFKARTVTADTEKELKKEINRQLSTGELDSGMGYKNLRGALMQIEITEIFHHDNGKAYTHKTHVIESFGNMTAEEERELQMIVEREL